MQARSISKWKVANAWLINWFRYYKRHCRKWRRRGGANISEQITAGIDKREHRNERRRWPVFAWREFLANSPFSRRAQSDFPASELIDGSTGSGLMREEWIARKKEIKLARGKRERSRWNHALIKLDQAMKEGENWWIVFVKKKNNFNPLHKFSSWQHHSADGYARYICVLGSE